MLHRTDITRRSLRSRLLSLVLRWRLKTKLTREDFDPLRFRNWLDREMGKRRTEAAVDIHPLEEGAVRGEWQIPHNVRDDQCLLYFHGGGYLFGSPLSYRSFTTRLAALAGLRCFVPDYRLAPEHPFPAAVEDALASYRWLLEQGVAAENIILAGDSAGGGLSLALLHSLRQKQLPLPAATITLSPYADLLATGESLDSNTRRCAMFSGDSIRRAAAAYLDGADGSSPLASPLYGDFSGFPPQLLYVSDSETLRDDGLRVAQAAADAGVEVDLRVWHGQPHVWPIFYPYIPEADRSLKEMAAFCRKSLKV